MRWSRQEIWFWVSALAVMGMALYFSSNGYGPREPASQSAALSRYTIRLTN